MWRSQLEHLSSRGVHATAIDLPAHGARRGEEFTLDNCSAAIEEGWNDLPQGPRILVGLSLGGYLGLHWAARTTSHIDAILAASCCTRPRGAPLAGYRNIAAAIERLPDQGGWLNEKITRAALSPQAAQDALAGGVALGVMAPALRAIAGVSPIADLEAISAPVWLVNGMWDHFRVEQRRYWRAVNSGRLIVVPRAGHLVSLDQPGVFNDVLTVLIEQVRNSVASDSR